MANFNFNKVILGGRLTADVELKSTSTGVNYVNFSIAVNRPQGKGEEQQTDFINIVAWRQKAEFIRNYFRKGSSICIVGSIQTRSWTDAQGNKRYATDVVADEVNFVDSKGDAAGGYTKPAEAYAPGAPVSSPKPQFEEIEDQEELPF